MAQAVSRRRLTAEARVGAVVSPCGIFDGQRDTQTGFYSNPPVSLCQYHSTLDPCSYITWGMNNRSVRGRRSETCFRPIDMKAIIDNFVFVFTVITAERLVHIRPIPSFKRLSPNRGDGRIRTPS
jgi:hypothetical protein